MLSRSLLLFLASTLALLSSASVQAATTETNKTKIIVPLYSWSETCWPELQNAAKAHPNVSWILVVNPNSGPSRDPSDPSLYCVPTLRSLLSPSSIIVGYVRTGYNSRALGEIRKDVNAYASWKNITVKGGQTVGLDGIFFDETSDTTTRRLQSFSSAAKTAFGNENVKIVSNPGTAVGSAYFSTASYVVDYESAFKDYKFTNLPRSLSQRKKSIVMIHDFDNSTTSLTDVLKPIITAKIGGVFITDLKIAEEDIYQNFGHNWNEFVGTVETLNG
ncbi:hypothetical protein JCM3765_002449 [Sporobolomyces pararoseus]